MVGGDNRFLGDAIHLRNLVEGLTAFHNHIERCPPGLRLR